MAEAIGLATSVIAVAEVTGRAIGLTLKIKSLWCEVKNVPAVLLEKAEELQDLDDYLKDAETQTASSPVSKSVIDDEIMQKSLRRARAALADIQNTIDDLSLQMSDPRKHRRKLTAARFVLHIDTIEDMERKLDRALELFKVAQGIYCTSSKVTKYSSHKVKVTEFVEQHKPVVANIAGKDNLGISQGTTAVGRLRLGFGDNTFQISLRSPSWLGSKVYSAVCHKSMIGWQINLTTYVVIKSFRGIEDAVKSDDPQALMKHLRSTSLTPLVEDEKGQNLLYLCAENRWLNIAKWLLTFGLFAGSYSSEENDCLEDSRSRSLIFEAANKLWHPPDSHTPSDLITLFASHAADGETGVSVEWMGFIAGLTDFGNFTRLLHSKSPASNPKWFYFESRLRFTYSGIRGSVWTLRQLTAVLPELKSLTRELVVSWRLAGRKYLIPSLVASGIGARAARAPRGYPARSHSVNEYARLAGQIIALDPESLIQAATTRHRASSALHMLMRTLLSNFQPCSTDQADHIIQSTLQVWVKMLHGNKVNLLQHGRQSRTTYTVPRRHVLPGWSFRLLQNPSEPRKRNKKRNREYRIEYIGISYGPLPEHWRVWWTVDFECYAGEFWRMLEDSGIKVPGSWVDDTDFDDKSTKLVPSWAHEGTGPLIWSEDRKIRPPI
ncbi:hypothetical protein CMEL01_04307 [Colletotrichum melonis]|uniref:NACHT-NTPase and P-loop NTPases N-terminal domain-containing protein n=1 Tax=Colletotrichum melonis TaxID=1209925 RepID=A0AAI9UBY6_9PEZI|nr:hypothetical protein CMEL01_04307 [Colletotrichum melonis]